MKSSSKRIIAIILLFVLAISATISANYTAKATLPRGDSDILRAEESLAEQIEFLLLNSTSEESRKSTLFQAYQLGITVDDLANVPLSAEDILILSGKVEVQNSSIDNREARTTCAPDTPN